MNTIKYEYTYTTNGIREIRPFINITLNGIETRILIDTGSNYTAINKEFMESIGHTEKKNLIQANGLGGRIQLYEHNEELEIRDKLHKPFLTMNKIRIFSCPQMTKKITGVMGMDLITTIFSNIYFHRDHFNLIKKSLN